VGNAVATLTDADKRKRYDMVGHENSTSDHVHRNYEHGFECKMVLIMKHFWCNITNMH